MAHYKELVGKLNTLLKRCYDSEKGYQQTAKKIANPALQQLLSTISDERRQYGHELKTEINRLGGEPDTGSSVKGDLHRTWINIKSAFSGGSEESILEECIRGEESMVNDYQAALKIDGIPIETQTLINAQLEGVHNDLNRMRNLEQIHD